MQTKFIVEGASKITGGEQVIEVEAQNEAEAELIANRRGLFVSFVRKALLPEEVLPARDHVHKKGYSSSQLLFLSKFLSGDSPTDYFAAVHWRDALGQDVRTQFQTFVRDGLLEQAGLHQSLNYKFKVVELKRMLKGIGKKVSGVKMDLISRLIEIDQPAMAGLLIGVEVYCCTPSGLDLAQTYLSEELARRRMAEQGVWNHLLRGSFVEAVDQVAIFEASQVFSRGLGVDWNNFDSSSAVRTLQRIFDATPSILRDMPAQVIDQIRPAAAMAELWGTGVAKPWLPEGFQSGIHLDGNAACRMLIFHAIHLRELENFRRLGLQSVRISGSGDCCEACELINGKRFRLDEAPELPYPACTALHGCRCLAIVDIEVPVD
jgi:hypothetical protein